jgi:hypothetical protein
MNPASLIHTSVDDAKSTLECALSRSPEDVLRYIADAFVLLNKLGYQETSRRKVFATIARKALKELTA